MKMAMWSYVDAYFGPPEWRNEAQAYPRGISELKAEADRIQSALSAMDVSAQQPMERRRSAWLRANVASGRSRLDMIEGARFRFRDEATRLFALTPALRPLASYDPVLGFDPGAARHRANIEGLPANHATGNGPAQRHGTSRGTARRRHRAPRASRRSASPGSPGLMLHRTARHDPSVLRLGRLRIAHGGGKCRRNSCVTTMRRNLI
jgi:hypothetical protein